LEQPFTRDADNALALASKPLRSGSMLTRDILSALGLSEILLQETERKSALETIEPYEPLPPMLDFQSEVRSRCLELFGKGISELLIQMPTGSGKTRTAMELIVDLVDKRSLFANGLSVVWLAHTEELCEQAIDSFSSVWAMRGAETAVVARMWGTYSPAQFQMRGGLIVAGTSRMHGLRLNDGKAFEALSSRTAVIVVDEAHRALAPTVQGQIKALRKTRNGLLIGLSATPARRNEPSDENTALANLFGRNLIAPDLGDDPINELRRRGILAKLERVELNYSDTEDLREENDTPLGDDEDLPESVLAALAANTRRNLAIIKELEARASRTEPAIVFCCSVAHADLLAAALRLKGLSAASVDCNMKRGARRFVIQQFSKGEIDVLLNFGVLSTGFDAPNVRTVLIARPTRSMILYSQMLGRGLRGPKMGGTDTCTLVDVRDHLGRFGDLSALYLRFKPYWTD
jgi:superfamily II DNA or RNA helicase